MNSLRARIVVALVLSIVCVIGIATATIVWLREGLGQKEQQEYVRLFYEEILRIAPLFGGDEKDGGAHLELSPTSGQPRPELTSLLQSQLHRAGSDLEVVVTQPAQATHPVASIKFKSGWLAIPVSDRHHPKEGA